MAEKGNGDRRTRRVNLDSVIASAAVSGLAGISAANAMLLARGDLVASAIVSLATAFAALVYLAITMGRNGSGTQATEESERNGTADSSNDNTGPTAGNGRAG